LQGRLNRRFEHRVITVTAGAGFGKTTLLVHALADHDLDRHGRDVWLGCEPADSSASTLLGSLLSAVRRGRGTDTAEPTVDDVCAAIWSCAPEQVCLVLDDAHLLDQGSAGELALADLATKLPENGHLVVAGRRRPPIPTARLVSHSRADDLTETDLRLDDDEMRRLVAGHGLDADDIRDLAGWPALVELTASAGGDVAERFVAEEVLVGLSAEQRKDLACLAAVGGADAALAAEVCGHPVDHQQLARLPLVTVDGSGSIRPHALWEQWLADELSAEEVAATRLKAASVLQQRGHHATAFELLAVVGEWQAALPVLFDACNDQTNPPWADVMNRWCDLVPAEYVDEPEVAYARGMIARGSDPWIPIAVDGIESASRAFQARGDVARENAARVRACYTAVVRADPRWMVACRDRIDELLSLGAPIEQFRSINTATIAMIDGRHHDCMRAADECGALEPRLRHFPGYYRAVSLLALGNAPAAVDDAEESARAALAIVPAAGSGWSLMLPAAVALVRGRLGEIDWAEFDDPGRRFAISERVPQLAMGAVARANTGDVAGAAESLAHVDVLLDGPTRRPLVDGFRAVAAAALAVACGDEAGAAAELDRGLRHDLDAAGAAQAVLWIPAHAYLLHGPAREMLDSIDSAAPRLRVLDACRALIVLRAGGTADPPALLDDVEAAVAALGVRLTTELVVRSVSPRNGLELTRTLAERWPVPVRAALHDAARHGDGAVRRRASGLAADIPIPPDRPIIIRFFGAATLVRGADAVDDPSWRRLRVRQLLACLAIHRRVRRQRLADLLWPDATEAAASANLRMTLSYVQALLEPDREKGDAPWFLQQDAGVLSLRPCLELDVDVWDVEARLDQAAQHRAAAQPTLELQKLLEALARWGGDAFEDLADLDWARDTRERLRARCLAASKRAVALLIAARRAAEADVVVERALAEDRWDEELHQLSIRLRVVQGDHAGCRRAYERCRAALAELDLQPSAAVEQLVTQFR
jgi:ATP/maltotriose-dependent transcriptional regulator MalT/DNA-binding SARP family transcriptional activator